MTDIAWGPRVYAELEQMARDRGLSMGAVADAMGLSRSLFHRWRHGTHPLYGTVIEVRTYLAAVPQRATIEHADLLE